MYAIALKSSDFARSALDALRGVGCFTLGVNSDTSTVFCARLNLFRHNIDRKE
jgi:hypothetical protein